MTPPRYPQRYDASLDAPEKDEAETAEAISQLMTKISTKTLEDGGHPLRGVHAKSHGLIKAELEVLPDLPPQLAQGLFATPGRHDVIMRFSTTPGDILDDDISTPRGVAIKILGVEGERLPGSEVAATQDFVMVNGPQFAAPNGKAFLANLKLLEPTTDKAEGAKKALSAVLRGVEKLVEMFGGVSGTVRSLGGEPPNNILGETFFGQLPLRYGDYIAKVQLVPVSPELVALTHKPVDLAADPNILRLSVIEHFRTQGGAWELRIQLCANLEDMPINEPTKAWDEQISPFVPVARLTAQPQSAWSPARSKAVDDGMAFNPWHGLLAHQPLGALMRIRRTVYLNSQRFRSDHNPTPVQEPVSLADLPD